MSKEKPVVAPSTQSAVGDRRIAMCASLYSDWYSFFFFFLVLPSVGKGGGKVRTALYN